MTCETRTRKNTPCSNHALKGGRYCYVHSFGKFSHVPWHKNPAAHLFIGVVGIGLTVWGLTTGATKSGQEKAQQSLDRLEGGVDELRAEKQLEIFRPISAQVRQETERQLRGIFVKHRGLQPEVVIDYLVRDDNRRQVAEEILKMCKSAGFPSKQINTTMTSETQPLNLYFHPESQVLAQEFMTVLGRVIKNKSVAAQTSPNRKKGELYLSLIGKPQFGSDGSVILR